MAPPDVTVVLDLPPEIRDHMDATVNDDVVRLIINTLSGEPGLRHFDVRALDASGRPVRLSSLIADEQRVVRSPAAQEPVQTTLAGQPPVFGQGKPVGALTGKTVFLSAGHGWYYHSTYGWLTQRGNTYGIVEDFSNVELVSQYLVQYLENAGADVWTCRDRCLSTVEVIVDNSTGPYVETGTWTTLNKGYLGSSRQATTSLTETATATFTPNIPVSGYYPLYLYYYRGTDRAPDALIRVNHTGGSTEIRVNQQMTPSNWRYLGTFYWFAGSGQTVTISNQSSSAGKLVIADAIRIGGGIGDQSPNTPPSAPPSGKRRADECAVYWAKYQGAPSSVYNPTSSGDGTDDVTARPLYAEWEQEAGEDAVYLSIHSNAYNGSIRGTETYMYLDGTPAGSQTLRDFVHNEVVNDLRAEWDSGWVDRGVKTADFGELRLLADIPGALVETAFHDHPLEASYLREPDFRRIAARAMYQGIAKYFGGAGVALLPEPPTHAVARSNGSTTSVQVSWRPPASGGAAGGPAEKYKVYRSPNGLAFDNGTETTNTSLTVSGLSPATVYYFRVTALNAGGESFPTPVLACKTPAEPGEVPMLIVDGYDAIDQSMNLAVIESAELGTVQRQFLDRRMNSYDYIIEHAVAIAASSASPAFDSALNEAVEAGDIAPADYGMVDWFVGRESAVSDTFSPAERSLINGFLGAGGGLFVSGMQIAYDLGAEGTSEEQAFLRGVLHADYVADDAGVYSANPVGGSVFDGLGTINFDDGTHGTYDAFSPDSILPISGSAESLVYAGGGTAGIEYSVIDRVLFMSFPFETIYPAVQRTHVMQRVIEYLNDNPCVVKTVFGDFDGDWDVDQVDFGHLQSCLTGPSSPQTDRACCSARSDGDSDVDQMDMAAFLRCLSGPGQTADPDCD